MYFSQIIVASVKPIDCCKRVNLLRVDLTLNGAQQQSSLIIFVAGIESALCHAIAETLGENLRLRCSRAS